VDVQLTTIELEKEEEPLSQQDKKKERVRERLARDKFRSQVIAGEMQASEILETDPELILIRKPFNKVSHFLSAD
jgi:NifB/MoaA-like Fe-S oxidoreductase